jgi:predicted MPP superfamily phosphohydrolase
MDEELGKLERRLGRLHARQRLGIETDHEQRVFGDGLNFFHLENWYSTHRLIALALKLAGLYWRGRRNAETVTVRRNRVALPHLPPAFDGFTLLHMTDLHADISEAAIGRAAALAGELARDPGYDICVMTGDYRGQTYGPFDATLAVLARLRAVIQAPIYAVLGNHDTVRMVPGLEEIGIRMLLNEHETFVRGDSRIHLAGIDDAHYYRVDNIEKVAAAIPHDEVSILLSHTAEIYRQAAHADFDLILCGHTHGGQICLPGGTALTLSAKMPRRMGAGAWRYNRMAGYTSVGVGTCVVPVRLNCLPEVVLHRLERAPQEAGGA